MSPEQIAMLVAAGAFVLLVLLLVVPLLKLGRALDEATIAIRKSHQNNDQLFAQANTTLTHVNVQLERVDGITANARAVTSNVSALTSMFTAVLGGPLVKLAALSYGVSKAVRARRKGVSGKKVAKASERRNTRVSKSRRRGHA